MEQSPRRRGVFKDVKEGFIGWNPIIHIAEESMNTPYYLRPHPFLTAEWREEQREILRLRDKLLISLCFLTGGRISEVLMLKPENFSVEEEWIFVQGMPLLKRYEIHRIEVDRIHEIPSIEIAKDYRWQPDNGAFVKYETSTEAQVVERQDFPIPRWEPLTNFVVDRLKSTESDWIFPTSGNPHRLEKPGVEAWKAKFGLESRAWISPQRCWQLVTGISERAGVTKNLGEKMLGIWDHWFRSMRANQLVRDYRFNDPMLDRFFGWVNRDDESRMSRRYTSTSTYELEDQMRLNKSRFDRNLKKDLT